MSSIVNGLRVVLSRPHINHAAVRYFYLQHACEAVRRVAMPSLSPTMEMGTIVKWHKKEGDAITPGDVLCDIQTDKAVVSLEYEDEGVLAKILKPDNSADIKVGALIALLVDEGEDWKTVTVPPEAAAAAPSSSPPPPAPKAAAPTSPPPAAAPAVSAQPHKAGGADWHLVGPSVKKILEEYKISAADVMPSGPKGNMVKGDVLEYVRQKGLQRAAPAAPTMAPGGQPMAAHTAKAPSAKGAPPSMQTPSTYVDIPLSNMRKVIAKRLTQSKTTIPHAYAAIDCHMGAVIRTRKKLIAEGMKVSVNDFIIKAAGYALEKSPRVNAIWEGDSPKVSSTVDISVAVATEGGLITPILPNVPYLSVTEISEMVKVLAEKARAGKLQPHEFQGGSFCISNLGMYGIKEFSAVINLPQVAILAVGATRQVAGENTEVCPIMTVTLSFDSRAMDEMDATRFLETFRAVMNNPELLMVGLFSSGLKSAFVVGGGPEQ